MLYVCMVCMYDVCMYVCMYVYMYVCMYVCVMRICINVMHVCVIQVSLSVCMHVWLGRFKKESGVREDADRSVVGKAGLTG